LAGVLLFRESLSMLQLAGVSLIVVGVALSAAAG
jgi:multidrug transporter EmrE-like cation transporter